MAASSSVGEGCGQPGTQGGQQRGASPLQRLQVSGFVIGCPGLPTTVQDAYPFERQGTQCRLMFRSSGTLLPIVGGSPEGARNGQSSPLDKGLTQEFRALPSPMDPVPLAAAFSDRGNAGEFLKIGGTCQ